jgi:hypothetical protein
MAKRRATVSLRKPSPAPEVEAPATATPAVEAAVSPVAMVSKEPEPVIPAPSAPVVAAAPEVMSIETFVSGAAAALERAVGDVPQARLLELMERGPAGYRELTVYLPEQLAREFSLHCMDRNLDMNRLVAAALERLLDSAPAKLDKHRMAAIARALIAHLAQRARGMLLSRRGWKATVAAPAAAVA